MLERKYNLKLFLVFITDSYLFAYTQLAIAFHLLRDFYIVHSHILVFRGFFLPKDFDIFHVFFKYLAHKSLEVLELRKGFVKKNYEKLVFENDLKFFYRIITINLL